MTNATSTCAAFHFEAFQDLPVRHGMSGRTTAYREEGSVGHSRDSDAQAIEANRSAFLLEIGIDPANLVIGRQTHGTRVQVVTAEHRGRGLYPDFDGFPETDGLVTNDASVALGVIVADCVPVLVYDPRLHAIGIVHAGWKGTVGRIAAEAIVAMTTAFGTQPVDVIVGTGPSIGPCCYEVGDEVCLAWQEAQVADGERAVVENGTSYHFDLWTANRLVLEQAGVETRNIIDSAVCVRCNWHAFFSHRASRQIGARPGRMLMAAQLEPRRTGSGTLN